MDCDLQDQPEEILKLYQKAQEGFMIVRAERSQRKDKWLKRILSRFFYNMLGYLTNTKQDHAIANFGIYHKKVIGSILSMNDYQRFFPTMVQWVGFKQTKIHVEHAERPVGDSSYNFNKLVRLTVDVILSFSDKPLRLAIKFGFLISSLALFFTIFTFILYLNNKIIVPGYTSLIISIWFLSGIIIIVLGVVGLYIGKTFDKVKGRPTYIIMDTTF